MIKKRLVGVVTVRDGLAVQSFGYQRYLPLGRPEVLVENLDRWGADEILVQVIDRSAANAPPDFALLDRISSKGISTPLIYSGAVRSTQDAVAVIQAGADRVCIDSLLHDAPETVRQLSERLGAQALIAALPVEQSAGKLLWLNHRTRAVMPLDSRIRELLRTRVISEALLIDWRHEGQRNGFDFSLPELFAEPGVPLILFGGLSEAAQVRTALQAPNVVAVAVGNFLSYREHTIQRLKEQLSGVPIRPAYYERQLQA